MQPLREQPRDSFPDLRRRCRQLCRSEPVRIALHHEDVGRHRNQRARHHAKKLRDRLLPRIATEQVAALQIREQVGCMRGSPRCDAGRHQVGRDVRRRDHAIEQLRDLPHRPDWRDIGLARRPRRHDRQEKRHQHREDSHPPADAKKKMAEHHAGGARQAHANHKPRGRHLDVRQFVVDPLMRPPAAEESAERARQAAERPQDRLPFERERQEPARHHHRRRRPEHPRHDPLVAGLHDPLLNENRADDAEADNRADQHRCRHPHPHDRPGRQHDQRALDTDRVFREQVAAECRRQEGQLRRKGIGGERLHCREEIPPDRDHGADDPGREERPRLHHRLAAGRVHALERFGGGDAGRERELIDVDQLPLERDRHEHAQKRQRRQPEHDLPPLHQPAGGEIERGQRRHEPRARHVAGGAGGATHRVVFERRERPVPPRRHHLLEHREDGIGDDRRRDRDAQTPAGLEPHVEVRDRHHPADDHPGDHRAGRELHGVVAGVDVGEPPPRGLAFVLKRRMLRVG